MSVAQWATVGAVGVWVVVAVILFRSSVRKPEHRRAGWAAAGMCLFAVSAVCIGLWGPHAGKVHDEPGAWHTAPLKP
ncbi:hypothetical protein ACWGJ9_09290 [Curtobacterium citreum]